MMPIIIGKGLPASPLQSYLARARYRVLVVEKDHFGGQITITDEVGRTIPVCTPLAARSSRRP